MPVESTPAEDLRMDVGTLVRVLLGGQGRLEVVLHRAVACRVAVATVPIGRAGTRAFPA